MSKYVDFDFVKISDIYPALQRCSQPYSGKKIEETHLDVLDNLARTIPVTSYARSNASRLACGSPDLIVILLEPTDNAEDVPFDEMYRKSPTLQCVDRALRIAFRGLRSLETTVVLDIRPFRSARARATEERSTRRLRDCRAYTATQEMVSMLRPDVVLICQCTASDNHTPLPQAIGDFVKAFSSNTARSGDLRLFEMPSGWKSVVVDSFHPMYSLRTAEEERPLKRYLSEYLFSLTFVIAANALVGTQVTGFGLNNIRRSMRYGPVLRVSECGVELTYRWTDENDVASNELLAQLEELGLLCEVSDESLILKLDTVS